MQSLRNRSFGRRILLATAISLATGCSSGGSPTTGPGSISLSIAPNAATIPQAGSTPVAATLTRSGGFTGTVSLTVTGAPSLPTGVSAAVSNIQTSGAVTTATVTISVDASTIPGAYPLVVHGTGSGVSETTASFTLTVTLPASYTLSLSAPVLSIVQGASAPTTTVAVTRVNFADAVTLGVTGLPASVTAAFAPPAPTANTSVLTLTVGAAAVPGVYNLVVTGTATAGNQTTPLALTITVAGSFTLTTTPASSVSVTQGSNTPVTVNIVRSGGNTSDVALTATGTLPAGLTLGFAPASTTTNASVLTITAAAGTAVGDNLIVIHGNTPGLAEQLANLTIKVVAPTGSLTVDVSACPVASRPVWVSMHDGPFHDFTDQWTVVTPVNNVYHLNFTQSSAGVAYVVLGTGTSAVNIYQFTLAEVAATPRSFCATPAAGIPVNGTVANLTNNFTGMINFGGATTIVTGNLSFQIANASTGVNDLVAYMKPLLGTGIADRGFINRALNPGSGGSVGTVDFTGTNSFGPAAASATVNGSVAGETLTQIMRYYTGTGANACTSATLYGASPITGTSFNAYGVPPANQVATDFHSIIISGTNGISGINGTTISRTLQEDFHTLTSRAMSPFVLPPVLNSLSVLTQVTVYKRLSLGVTTMPPELNSVATVIQNDQTTPGKSMFMSVSAGYRSAEPFGGAAVFRVPGFSGLAGWDNAWGPAPLDILQWTITATGVTPAGPCQEGHRSLISTLSGVN